MGVSIVSGLYMFSKFNRLIRRQVHSSAGSGVGCESFWA